jgi:hypothetical protein
MRYDKQTGQSSWTLQVALAQLIQGGVGRCWRWAPHVSSDLTRNCVPSFWSKPICIARSPLGVNPLHQLWLSLHRGESQGNECEHAGSSHDSSEHISSVQTIRSLSDHPSSSDVNHMNLQSSMKFQLAEANHQSKQDGTQRGPFELRTLCDLVVSKHEDFDFGPRVSLGKGFQPLYQVFKLSMFGRLRLVELIP